MRKIIFIFSKKKKIENYETHRYQLAKIKKNKKHKKRTAMFATMLFFHYFVLSEKNNAYQVLVIGRQIHFSFLFF